MMSEAMVMIITMGFVIFSVRSIAFIFANYITLPEIVKETFELLPPAILSVIIASGTLFNKSASLAKHYQADKKAIMLKPKLS
ncbi:MAG: AzlD domain-containing protein [Ostreibacterium sp.]